MANKYMSLINESSYVDSTNNEKVIPYEVVKDVLSEIEDKVNSARDIIENLSDNLY